MLGNGAGLVMSLLDLIGAAGGRAANFCDVGGGAERRRIADALEIVLSDDRVRVLLVASSAASRAATRWRAACSPRCRAPTRSLPVVVRLAGTNARGGQAISGRRRPGGLHVDMQASPTRSARRSPGLDGDRLGFEVGRDLSMAILVDQHSRVLVQGMTGREGAFHAARMLAAGTNVVAGVSPGKGGQTVGGVPVFDAVPRPSLPPAPTSR